MPKLSATPIKQALDHRSIRQLSRELAERFGTNPASESRQLARIRNGHIETVTERTAERFAAGLGYHLLDLWPDWR
jgi:hypothetical protein